MANIRCSIELEPRTLNEGQLNLAREVAAEAVQNMQPKEASDIFIKAGFHVPVPVPEEMESKNGMETAGNEHMLEEGKEKPRIIEKPCLCATNNILESPLDHLPNKLLREPLSAPF